MRTFSSAPLEVEQLPSPFQLEISDTWEVRVLLAPPVARQHGDSRTCLVGPPPTLPWVLLTAGLDCWRRQISQLMGVESPVSADFSPAVHNSHLGSLPLGCE